MYGNVSEWVLDEYRSDAYSRAAEAGANQNLSIRVSKAYVRPTKKYPRVARGGSFELEIEDCRSAARQKSSEEWSDEDPNLPQGVYWHTSSPSIGTGFRLIRPLIPPSLDEHKKIFWQPLAETVEDARMFAEDSGRGVIGRVDPDLPEAIKGCLLYTSPSPRDQRGSRMPSSA